MLLRDRQRELSIAPLWRLGFRPFFLGGALFAVLAIGLWAAVLLGYLPGWQPVGGSLAWHRHELPFGFAGAIIAGFLLTAVQNWTGRPGLSGWPLAGLFALWLLARLAWLVGVPLPVLLALQLPLLPLLALVLGRQLWVVRQWRNYPLVVVVLLMAACEWLLLYGLWRGDDELQRRGALAGLWLIAALVSIIGGRVIPFFTQRGLNQIAPATPRPRLDVLVLVLSLSLALLFASGLALQPSIWMLPLLLALAALHGLRLWHWYNVGIWRVPLLWSLHLAYAWLPLALLTLAAWHAGWLSNASLAYHALALGTVGGAILAMLARVSLGHTGRPLQPPAVMGWAFACLQLAVVARVLLVPFAPASGLGLSSLLWIAAFALFVRHYAVMFCTARVDGQPG
ncbi:NnrS family protein [Pseudomonas anguilliseptica]|uniref:NnrS family protein n=1 Tax=Pseudomonas anguilliseptica TaxID=53406 RepID=UPI001F34E9F4|nr:NnrS family protein [Pseudomonas anguilliseptica]MCE5364344.1 NnrS family protein [Pseudomonas anguilliseptica]